MVSAQKEEKRTAGGCLRSVASWVFQSISICHFTQRISTRAVATGSRSLAILSVGLIEPGRYCSRTDAHHFRATMANEKCQMTDGKWLTMTKQDKQKQRHGISELFNSSPHTTTLVMVGIVLFGLICLSGNCRSAICPPSIPDHQCQCELAGRKSPRLWLASVATPSERQFSGIAGIDSINSTNSQGSTSITSAIQPESKY